jgi:hypothetical protein
MRRDLKERSVNTGLRIETLHQFLCLQMFDFLVLGTELEILCDQEKSVFLVQKG